ncbi:hypothetical protein Clacol_005243 [Clathrus columnatus]|uniref:Cytochrome P450 n=1 Tax=Clathrus columnatus TaxID=1419009 RepID=A0AAV5ACV1_9AGAM|nr:hypothetical protein Clacol_005243 [Clathrus columnatus]
MPASLYILLSGAFLFIFIRLLYGSLRRRFIDKIPGPPRTSWINGNVPDLLRSPEISDAHFAWLKEYGTVLKTHAEFGAIQYILNTSGYNFPKTPSARASIALMLGKGIVWADGSQHAKQRKIMTPAFSFGTLRDFIPMFRNRAQKTVNKIKEQIESTGNPVVNIVPWLSRTTLEIIGAASADYNFEAIDGGQTNQLAQAYNNLMADAFYKPSDRDIAVSYLMGKVPDLVKDLMRLLPTRSLKRMKRYMPVAMRVAQDVVDKQTALYVNGKEGSKDLMSVLVRANLSEDPKTKLTNEEVISQLTTFFFAGHETTASSLNWALYELSRHPEYQTKLRDEIKALRTRVAERGDDEITITDLDSMQYLPALMKETLRYHPIASGLFRIAGRDDHIPLDIPIKLTNGEVVSSIPIERGQQVFMSIINYNRLKSVWGDDADEWRPERFLEDHEHKQQTKLGVIGNMYIVVSLPVIIFYSFSILERPLVVESEVVLVPSDGVSRKIPLLKFLAIIILKNPRKRVLEMQAILLELIENFEFSPPPGNIEIIRASVRIMGPMVKGSKSGRTELPLTVKPFSCHADSYGRVDFEIGIGLIKDEERGDELRGSLIEPSFLKSETAQAIRKKTSAGSNPATLVPTVEILAKEFAGTILAGGNSNTYVEISEIFLGPARKKFVFTTKYKSNALELSRALKRAAGAL